VLRHAQPKQLNAIRPVWKTRNATFSDWSANGLTAPSMRHDALDQGRKFLIPFHRLAALRAHGETGQAFEGARVKARSTNSKADTWQGLP
jgi:hypothetical protein